MLVLAVCISYRWCYTLVEVLTTCKIHVVYAWTGTDLHKIWRWWILDWVRAVVEVTVVSLRHHRHQNELIIVVFRQKTARKLHKKTKKTLGEIVLSCTCVADCFLYRAPEATSCQYCLSKFFIISLHYWSSFERAELSWGGTERWQRWWQRDIGW